MLYHEFSDDDEHKQTMKNKCPQTRNYKNADDENSGKSERKHGYNEAKVKHEKNYSNDNDE